MIHEFRCPECKNIFEANVPQNYGGRYKLIYKGPKVFRKLPNGQEIEHIDEPITTECPICKSKAIKIITDMKVSYSDNITPNSGFATVDKRHSDGMYWDAKRSLSQSKKVNRAMKEDVKSITQHR